MSTIKTKQALLVNSLINTLIHSDFYGAVTFKFEKGNIVHIKEEINLKIESLENDFKGTVKSILMNQGIHEVSVSGEN